MTLVLAILGAIPAIYGLVVLIQKAFKKTPAEKAIDVVARVEAAMEKAEKTGDTSDIEKILNN